MKDSPQRNIKIVYKVVCIDDKFTKTIAVFRGKNGAYEFIKAILKEYEYC